MCKLMKVESGGINEKEFIIIIIPVCAPIQHAPEFYTWFGVDCLDLVHL